jgi:hypothetical protein
VLEILFFGGCPTSNVEESCVVALVFVSSQRVNERKKYNLQQQVVGSCSAAGTVNDKK